MDSKSVNGIGQNASKLVNKKPNSGSGYISKSKLKQPTTIRRCIKNAPLSVKVIVAGYATLAVYKKIEYNRYKKEYENNAERMTDYSESADEFTKGYNHIMKADYEKRQAKLKKIIEKYKKGDKTFITDLRNLVRESAFLKNNNSKAVTPEAVNNDVVKSGYGDKITDKITDKSTEKPNNNFVVSLGSMNDDKEDSKENDNDMGMGMGDY